jgi:hypothetical protein
MKLHEIQQPAANRDQQLRAAREASLEKLDLEDRRLVVSTLLADRYDDHDLYKTAIAPHHKDEFIKSITGQWLSYGKLSEKQVAAIVRYANKQSELEAKLEMMPPIKLNEKQDFIGVVKKIEEIEVQDNYNGGMVKTHRVTVASRFNIAMTFKTNREKLLTQMEQLMHSGKKTKFTAMVIWVSPNLDRVAVKSMGLRFEDA